MSISTIGQNPSIREPIEGSKLLPIELFSHILQFCDLSAVVALRNTCRAWQEWVETESPKIYQKECASFAQKIIVLLDPVKHAHIISSLEKIDLLKHFNPHTHDLNFEPIYPPLITGLLNIPPAAFDQLQKTSTSWQPVMALTTFNPVFVLTELNKQSRIEARKEIMDLLPANKVWALESYVGIAVRNLRRIVQPYYVKAHHASIREAVSNGVFCEAIVNNLRALRAQMRPHHPAHYLQIYPQFAIEFTKMNQTYQAYEVLQLLSGTELYQKTIADILKNLTYDLPSETLTESSQRLLSLSSEDLSCDVVPESNHLTSLTQWFPLPKSSRKELNKRTIIHHLFQRKELTRQALEFTDSLADDYGYVLSLTCQYRYSSDLELQSQLLSLLYARKEKNSERRFGMFFLERLLGVAESAYTTKTPFPKHQQDQLLSAILALPEDYLERDYFLLKMVLNLPFEHTPTHIFAQIKSPLYKSTAVASSICKLAYKGQFAEAISLLDQVSRTTVPIQKPIHVEEVNWDDPLLVNARLETAIPYLVSINPYTPYQESSRRSYSDAMDCQKMSIDKLDFSLSVLVRELVANNQIEEALSLRLKILSLNQPF